MTGRTNRNVPELAGSRDAEKLADFADDCATIVAENQPKKPEIDLKSWLALGANKPSRTDRHQKRGWKRDPR
jgi:hypothetical protein